MSSGKLRYQVDEQARLQRRSEAKQSQREQKRRDKLATETKLVISCSAGAGPCVCAPDMLSGTSKAPFKRNRTLASSRTAPCGGVIAPSRGRSRPWTAVRGLTELKIRKLRQARKTQAAL